MTFSGGATSNLGGLMQGLVPGGQRPGTIVGQEQPEWDFPMGIERVPTDIQEAFFRGDAGPTGFNEYLQQLMQSNPGIIDRLRSYINMGVIRPKNAAAQNIVTGYGGYRAGDMTPLGPLINGMPSGLNESQLNTFANILQTGTQYNLGLLEQMGYFDGMPTLERERVMGELAQGWMQQAIDQFRATEEQRGAMAQEGLEQQTITNQNIQEMARIFGGQMVNDPATGQPTFQPTEEARQFDTEQSGYLDGQATLTREQQAFNQAKDVAALASNPRNYIEAQMLANARGGLGGMAPNNQVQQTTFGPATTVQQPQFATPGGAYQQLQTLPTMQGQPGAMTAPGGQAGTTAPVPTPQAIGQPAPAGTQGTYNLQNPGTWQQMLQQAGGQWGSTRPMLDQVRQSQGWQSMTPAGSTPPGPGPGQPPWPGVPSSGLDGQYSTDYAGGTRGTATGSPQQRLAQMGGNQQNVAATANLPVTTSAFSQALLQNRVVPKTGQQAVSGQWMTPQAIQQRFNPNKVRTQDYLRGTNSEQQGFNAVGSLAGYSDEDLSGILKNNLPSFSAPKAGRMI